MTETPAGAAPRTRNVGMVLFDDVEELDFVGPFEVFQMAATVAAGERGEGAEPALRCLLLAEHDRPIRCAKGLRVLPDATLETAPPLDVVLVPGGIGTRTEIGREALPAFLRKVAPGCEWITSVCTGAALLERAGLLRGRRATTHWAYISLFRELADPSTTILDDVRFVRDGPVVTAAGVSAGIDMALWLVGQMFTPAHARATQRAMEYVPAPPYTAEV